MFIVRIPWRVFCDLKGEGPWEGFEEGPWCARVSRLVRRLLGYKGSWKDFCQTDVQKRWGLGTALGWGIFTVGWYMVACIIFLHPLAGELYEGLRTETFFTMDHFVFDPAKEAIAYRDKLASLEPKPKPKP